jgi:cardiolipin synthase
MAMAGCSVPDADESIAKSIDRTPVARPQILSAAGPLDPDQSRQLLENIGENIGAGTEGVESLRRHLRVEAAVAGTPLTTDNAVRVLRNGDETFRAIAAAIRGARHNLNLEYYTIEDVALEDGKGGHIALSDLLIEKRRQGVAVNIIYDSYGSSDTPAAFFARLEQAGVKLLDFHPVDPLNPANALTVNDRDHRKILVADGEAAITGGVNLSKNYESKSPGGGSEKDDAAKGAGAGIAGALGLDPQLPDRVRDTAVLIEGPAVAQLQALFRDHWKAEHGPPLDETGFFPGLQAKGHQVARIIGSTPKQDRSRYYVTLISALRNAQSRAWITAAYFVPTAEEMRELVAAARRGVDVRLLLPHASDSQEAVEAARSHYSELLDAGVKIYEAENVVLHAKTVVIDGVWSAVGSSNFDHRSVLFNDEVDAVVLGPETAHSLEAIFEDGIKSAKAIDREEWEESRPLLERARGFFARLWQSLL